MDRTVFSGKINLKLSIRRLRAFPVVTLLFKENPSIYTDTYTPTSLALTFSSQKIFSLLSSRILTCMR